MKLISTTLAKRNAAIMVLLAWVFALVSGVANACLLETPTTHAHVVAAASEGAQGLAVMAGHTGVVADHGDESPTAKAPCLKVCDDSSTALVSQPSMAQADTGPASLIRILWLVVAADDMAAFPVGDAAGPALLELPLRVRYSRLAL